MTDSISKVFKFDKIAFYGDRRINQPEIEMTINYGNKGPVLSICGSVWNSKHTDCLMCGQCLDEMNKFESLKSNPTFRKLYEWHQHYHLNDMHAGTVKQDAALEDARKAGHKICSYEDQCKYLESVGLLEDDGYKYGSAWLYREIPEDVLLEMEEFLTD